MVLQGEAGKKTAVIRTSDRNLFKKCRRNWMFQSHMQRNLEPKQAQMPLWFGTGIHFALEDFFNPNSELPCKTAAEAFDLYVKATRIQKNQQMPDDWQEMSETGKAMLDYMETSWLQTRDPLTTFVHNGIPQLEINFIVDIPFDVQAHYPHSPYDKVVYSGTIDRIIIDDYGRLWLVDYKTAKNMKTSHFANDPQVTAYCWAASEMYPDYEIAGMIYWQFLKAHPKPPEPLKSGKISTAQNMKTSRPLYRRALIDAYGSVEKAPAAAVQKLNDLAMLESVEQDAYIRRDKIYKNAHSLQAEGAKILSEMADMLNPDLALYPNANFMCPHMCAFYEICVSMDDGSDWEQQLEAETQQRAKGDESWRKSIPAALEMIYGDPEPTYDFDNPPVDGHTAALDANDILTGKK